MDNERKRALLRELISFFAQERGEATVHSDAALEGATDDELWLTFRALVNTRPAGLPPREILQVQDELLQGLIAQRGIVTLADTLPVSVPAPGAGQVPAASHPGAVPAPDTAAPAPDPAPAASLSGSTASLLVSAAPRLRLWRGDITALAVDAIVNAANSQMTGCWAANHACIDNAIHTFAGVQLRARCDELMRAQGHPEPTGQAQVTPGYNLPARYVIHTVGPIANGSPTAEHARQLASCYRSCLQAAADAGASSLAFCGISTGVFGYPPQPASHIAVSTVTQWLEVTQAELTVVFNVFSAAAEAIYRKEIGLPSFP